MNKRIALLLAAAVCVGVPLVGYFGWFKVSTVGPMSAKELRRHLTCALRAEGDLARKLHESQVEKWGNRYCLEQIHKRATVAQSTQAWLTLLKQPDVAINFILKEPVSTAPPKEVWLALVAQHKGALLKGLVAALQDRSGPSKYPVSIDGFGKRNALFHVLSQLDPGWKQSFALIRAAPQKYRTFLAEHARWLAQSLGIGPVAQVLFKLVEGCPSLDPKAKAFRAQLQRCDQILGDLRLFVGRGTWHPSSIKQGTKDGLRFHRATYDKISDFVLRRQHYASKLQTQSPYLVQNKGFREPRQILTLKLDKDGKPKEHVVFGGYTFDLKARRIAAQKLRRRLGRYNPGWIILDLPKGTHFSCSAFLWFAARPAWFATHKDAAKTKDVGPKISAYSNISANTSCGDEQQIPYLTWSRNKAPHARKMAEHPHSHILAAHPIFPPYMNQLPGAPKASQRRALLGPLPPGTYHLRFGKGANDKWLISREDVGKSIAITPGKTVRLSLPLP